MGGFNPHPERGPWSYDESRDLRRHTRYGALDILLTMHEQHGSEISIRTAFVLD